MSKTWYPVLNYEKCIECGACFNKCSNDVFRLENMRPVVVNTVSCTEGCHGCGSLCPSGAIEYIGDVSDTPIEGCSCSGCCNS
nr:4Fe-4S dicluster domain-containing protein [uncultured Caproiciproducens sp.]